MWKAVSRWLYQVSSTWLALSALVGFLLFTALVLPAQSARAKAYSGDAPSPDTSFFYSPGELYRAARAYGDEGRAAYVRSRFTFDLIWPLVYTFFLTTVISWFYARAFPQGNRWRMANLAPLLATAFDYLENVSTSIVMLRYPARTAPVAALAPVLTASKWVLIGSSFALLAAGAFIAVWRWIRSGAD